MPVLKDESSRALTRLSLRFGETPDGDAIITVTAHLRDGTSVVLVQDVVIDAKEIDIEMEEDAEAAHSDEVSPAPRTLN